MATMQENPGETTNTLGRYKDWPSEPVPLMPYTTINLDEVH